MRRAFTILILFAFAATACSVDSPETTATAAPAPTPTATPATVPPFGEPLPFDAVLIELFGTDDIDMYRYDIQRDAERLLAECMAEAGFEFNVPNPLPPSTDPALLQDLSYVEENGFAIVTRFRDWVADFDLDSVQRDLNQEYLQTLTGAEIQEYFLILEGEEPPPGQLSENPGCRGTASERAYSTWNQFLDELPNFTAMGEERDTHPDWLDARAQWIECMSGMGFDYADPDQVRSDVENRISTTLSESYPNANLPLIEVDGVWQVDPAADAILDELKLFEIDVAVADRQCTAPLVDQFRSVEFEVQQGFVDRNQATIDELLPG